MPQAVVAGPGVPLSKLDSLQLAALRYKPRVPNTCKTLQAKLNRPCKAHTKVLCAAMASKKYKKGHAPRERQNTMLVFNHDSIPFLVGLLLMAVLGIYVYVLYCAISHYRRV